MRIEMTPTHVLFRDDSDRLIVRARRAHLGRPLAWKGLDPKVRAEVERHWTKLGRMYHGKRGGMLHR